MREIKFRAWVNESKKMYQDVTFDKVEVCWFDPEARQDPDDPEPGCWVIVGDRAKNSMLPHAILMQYTGLRDRQGKEIYEGDIFRCQYDKQLGYGEGQYGGVVFWGDELGAWMWHPADEDEKMSTILPVAKDMEVIGNIYENADLLGGVKK